MHRMTKGTWLILLAACAGCATQYQPMAVDPKSGYLTPENNQGIPDPASKASVSLTQRVDVTKYQGAVLVTGSGMLASKVPFLLTQMTDIGVFADVMDTPTLQQRLITAGVQDKVPETDDLLGLNKAYRAYKPFLWIHFELVSNDGGRYVDMIATDPDNGQDLFKANVSIPALPGISNGSGSTNPDTTTDQDTWYPLFNSFIDWATASGAKVKAGKVPAPAATPASGGHAASAGT